MRTYYVTVRIEEVIEVQATCEDDAIYKACFEFDPTAHDKEVVEVYTDDDDI